MDSSTDRIADFCSALAFADLPAGVIRDCKRRIIDTVGCGLGALDSEPSRIARRVALRATVARGACVLGTNHRTLAEAAAFANGVTMRYLDANDAFPGGGGHPSDVIAPVLAAADAAGAGGEIAITATIVAYEVYHQFWRSMIDEEKKVDVVRGMGFDHVLYTVIASAAGAAKAMGLGRAQIANALSLAIAPYLPLYVTRRGNLSMWKGCAAANAARNGVFAAVLSAEGINGPESPIEGVQGLRDLFGRFNLGPFGGGERPFRISDSGLKFHPAEYHAQSPITAALQLPSRVAVKDIDTVTVYSYLHAVNEIGAEAERWHPSTRETADHSMAFIVAAILVHGKFSDEIFSPENLRHPVVNELVDRVSIKEDPGLTRKFPQAFPCRIEIVTRDGQRKIAATDFPRGHHQNPMTDDEINTKFRGFAGRVLTREQKESALDQLWNLEKAATLINLFESMRSTAVK